MSILKFIVFKYTQTSQYRGSAIAHFWTHPTKSHSNCTSLKYADLLEKLVCKIVTYQINDLGIQPKSKELALHRQMGTYDLKEIDTSIEYMKEIANWLTMLRNANNKTGLYDHHHFNQVLADIQLSMICHCLKRDRIYRY